MSGEKSPLRGPIVFAAILITVALLISAGSQAVNTYYSIQVNIIQEKLTKELETLKTQVSEFEKSKTNAIDNTVALKQSMIDLASDLKKKGITVSSKLIADLQSIGFEKEVTQ